MHLYEMHQHTAGCSACGLIQPEDAVKALKKQGFSGMVLTNHFFHGNTGIRRQMPWADFVRPFEEDWLRAKAAGDRLDFDVLFGLEEWVGGGKEVLLYGITPQLLYDHPELRESPSIEEHLKTLCRIVHAAGGLVIQAHPFRVRNYIKNPWQPLPIPYLDGIEVYNAGNSPLENARAEQLADEYDLITTAGTDAHEANTRRYGLAVETRLRTNEDLISALKSGDYSLYVPE